MITKDNITAVFNNMKREDINTVMDSDTDYISMRLEGNWGYLILEPFDFGTDIEEEILDSGGIICDKDQFLQLFKESDSINPFLLELI